jgi:hypothetical protein
MSQPHLFLNERSPVTTIIQQNKQVSHVSPSYKLQVISQRAEAMTAHIQQVKSRRKLSVDNRKDTLVTKLNLKFARFELRTRKQEIHLITMSWGALACTLATADFMKRRLAIKQALRLRADKHMGRLLFACIALGKFLRVLHRRRIHKSLVVRCRQRLSSVVKFTRRWLRRRRQRFMELVAERAERYCSQKMITLLMIRWRLQVKSKQIRSLQKFIRFRMFQRQLKLSIMVNTWNALEKVSVRSKLPRKIDKSRLSEGRSTVPDQIKVFYIRAKIRLNTLRHFEQSKALAQQILHLQAEFKRKRHALEADRLLKRDTRKVELVLPQAPVLYYSLKDEEIQELIELAQGQRIAWDLILRGAVKDFSDLQRAMKS